MDLHALLRKATTMRPALADLTAEELAMLIRKRLVRRYRGRYVFTPRAAQRILR
jgi:hypothetical protein